MGIAHSVSAHAIFQFLLLSLGWSAVNELREWALESANNALGLMDVRIGNYEHR